MGCAIQARGGIQTSDWNLGGSDCNPAQRDNPAQGENPAQGGENPGRWRTSRQALENPVRW